MLQWFVAAQFVKNFGSVGVVAILMFGYSDSASRGNRWLLD